MELERGGLSEGEDCSAPGEDGGFRAYCLGTSSEPWSSGWGVYVCLCDRCIRFPVEQAADPKMHVLSGALVAQPRYLLLVLNNYSPDSNKLTVHRKHD